MIKKEDGLWLAAFACAGFESWGCLMVVLILHTIWEGKKDE